MYRVLNVIMGRIFHMYQPNLTRMKKNFRMSQGCKIPMELGESFYETTADLCSYVPCVY
jgi:hypothetical protein